MKILSFDLETGGFNPSSNGITQISFVVGECQNGKFVETDTYTSIIKPIHNKEYSKDSLQIQKVTWEDLNANGVPFENWRIQADKFVKYHFGQTKDCVAYAYNVGFDISFLLSHCKEKWCPVPLTSICAMHSFRHWCQVTQTKTENSKLPTACKTIGIGWDEEKAHGSLYDARKTAQLIAYLLHSKSWVN